MSYFFPAHNEEANLESLVDEALATLPSLADTFEIIAVNDGSRDRTRGIADGLAARYPDVVRAIHHPTNYGYGAALRSGFAASRYDLIAFDEQYTAAQVMRAGRHSAVPVTMRGQLVGLLTLENVSELIMVQEARQRHAGVA